MNPTANNNEMWLPCDDGQIRQVSHFVKGKQAQLKRRDFLQKAGIACGALLVGGIGYSLTRGGANTTRPVAPMACVDVIAQLQGFIDSSLGQELTEQIENHLKTCVACRNESLKIQGKPIPEADRNAMPMKGMEKKKMS